MDVDPAELHARIVSVLDPEWARAARADYEAMLAPWQEEIARLLAAMKPGDTLKLVHGHGVVIVPARRS